MKTRNISIAKYFEQLEKEFVLAELRNKIYSSRSDKDYYADLMEFKKGKIVDIAQRNNLDSIFNSQQEKSKMYLEVYGKFGYPNFEYKKEEHRIKFSVLDREHYYSTGFDYKVLQEDGQYLIGTMASVDLKNSVCVINFTGFGLSVPKSVSLEKIQRIL